MKLYHILIASMIVTVIVVGFTSFGGAGLLYDMKYEADGTTSYNSEINITRYSAYDRRTEIDGDVGTLKNTSETVSPTSEDTEQSLYSKMWSGTKDLGNSFTTAYDLATEASDDLNIPPLAWWFVTTLLGLFILYKTIGAWFFDR